MEYKKSEPTHGSLDGRYTTCYEYEFPRATRTKGRFLPQGSVRLREFLYSDGGHGQLVQITLISADELGKGSEQRLMVDKILDLNREGKKFREGNLASRDLSGEIREYAGKKLICVDDILTQQEKIGLFASARRVKERKLRQRRNWHWKLRFQGAITLALFGLGVVCGVFAQKYGLFDLDANPFYQNYVLTSIHRLGELFDRLFR